MKFEDRWFWELLAKTRTPYGLCAGLLLLQYSVPSILRQRVLADVSAGGYGIATVSEKLLAGVTALALFLLILWQQIRHYAIISKPPLREKLFHRVKSRSNLVVILIVTACFLVYSVLVYAAWTLLFQTTMLLFCIAWSKEAGVAAESRMCNLLQSVRKRGAEETALLLYSKMWSGAVAMLIAAETQAWAIWNITHSSEVTIGVGGFSSLVVGVVYGLLMLMSYRVAKRLSKKLGSFNSGDTLLNS